MLMPLSCSNRQNSAQSDDNYDYASDQSGEEEDGDADEVFYKVILSTSKPKPGEEHLSDNSLKFGGLTVCNSAGNYLLFNDETDYVNFARSFLFACMLAERAGLSSQQEWADFQNNVLNNTYFAPYYPACMDNISDPKWRESTKKLWYDRCRDMPILIGKRSYGKQVFKYPLSYPYDTDCNWNLIIKRASADNEFGLPDGAIIINTGLW